MSGKYTEQSIIETREGEFILTDTSFFLRKYKLMSSAKSEGARIQDFSVDFDISYLFRYEQMLYI